MRNAGATAGPTLIRRQCSVTFDNGDSIDGDIEFFGDNLAHGDFQTGADIDLACVDRGGAVRVNGKKAVDFARIDRFSEI